MSHLHERLWNEFPALDGVGESAGVHFQRGLRHTGVKRIDHGHGERGIRLFFFTDPQARHADIRHADVRHAERSAPA